MRRFIAIGWITGVILGIFLLLRLILLLWGWGGLNHHPQALLQALWLGLRMDLVVTGVLLFPLVLLLASPRWDPARRSLQKRLFYIGGALAGFVFLFLVLCDYFFFDEFTSRFNYVAIDYIFSNTAEVLGNIWQSYPVVVAVLGVAVSTGLLIALLRRPLRQALSTPAPKRFAWIAVFAWVGMTGSVWSTLHMQALTDMPDRVLAEIGANGFYTLGYALMTNNLVYPQHYKTIDSQEAVDRLHRRLSGPGVRWRPILGNPLVRKIPARPGLGRKNVVVILEESLGSEFVSVLHPRADALTPHMDSLSKESLFFRNFYSTGNRTVRALEAVLGSFPPIPGTSIVKRHPAQPVETLATLLRDQGYATRFIYGGRGIFDDMRSFALANGFEQFIELKDYPKDVFRTIWGVADEDVFRRSIEDMRALSQAGKPFFVTLLTVSNHRPYTYPEGRIDRDPKEHRRENVVKYADWAIGDFFSRVKNEAYFKDTVFVLLGDHGARVYGSDAIPLPSYEIPLLIYAPGLVPARAVDRLGCSMDVAPTLLGMLGLDYESTFFGHDLLQADTGRALLQHDRDIGLLEGGKLAVLSTGRSGKVYDVKSGATVQDDSLLADAIAYYQTAYRLFSEGNFHVSSRPSGNAVR